MMPMNMRILLQPLALTGLSLALAACVSTAPPVVKPVDTTTPAQRLAAVDAAAGPDDKELSVQPLRDSQVEDLRLTAQAQRQANDLAGAASSLDHALDIVAGDPAVLERAELALLQGQWAQAETFARKAVDLGSKTGPLCRRHWATIEQSRLARARRRMRCRRTRRLKAARCRGSSGTEFPANGAAPRGCGLVAEARSKSRAWPGGWVRGDAVNPSLAWPRHPCRGHPANPPARPLTVSVCVQPRKRKIKSGSHAARA